MVCTCFPDHDSTRLADDPRQYARQRRAVARRLGRGHVLPVQWPPNCRDVTAEKIGTVMGISGATAAKATKPG
jgi:hypothetical protein